MLMLAGTNLGTKFFNWQINGKWGIWESETRNCRKPIASLHEKVTSSCSRAAYT